MNASVKCSKCGRDNEISRLFCKYCGDKLDLSNVRTGPSIAGMGISLVKRLIRFAVLLGLLAVLGLLLWPTEPSGLIGTDEDARSLHGKLVTLDGAIRGGTYARSEVTEQEINAYLSALLRPPDIDGSASDTRFVAESVVVSLDEGSLTVHVLTSWRGLNVSYEIEGRPVWNESGFALDPQRVQLGHLTMPGAAGDWLAQRVAVIFERLESERFVLDHLTIHDGKKHRLRVETRVQ